MEFVKWWIPINFIVSFNSVASHIIMGTKGSFSIAEFEAIFNSVAENFTMNAIGANLF